MRSYYYDESDADKTGQEPHDSGVEVPLEKLAKLGVLYRKLDCSKPELIEQFAKEQNYKNKDVVTLSVDTFPGGKEELQSKLAGFFKEHIHEDVEARYIIKGSGYFDVRDENDKWIRNHLFAGDLIVLPAGIYHRYTLDIDNYSETVRLFTEEPKWVAIYRPAPAENEVRQQYLATLVK